jgi:hypothetical protein
MSEVGKLHCNDRAGMPTEAEGGKILARKYNGRNSVVAIAPAMTPSPTPDPEPSLNEKIADIVLKAIMMGGVAGGGLGAFWSLFKDRDVWTALASAAIGVGISYGAKILLPIHRGNERRLEKIGEAANQRIDRVGEAAIAKFTSVKDRYFACQAADCEICSTEGMGKISGIFTPMLEQVFVPLELDHSRQFPGWGNLTVLPEARTIVNTKMSAFDGQVDIWRMLALAKRDSIYRQMAILAWGGYGKTTLLRHIAYRLSKHQQPDQVPRLIPVLLLLRKYRDKLAQDQPIDLPTLIEQHHISGLPDAEGLRTQTDWARTMLKQGKMLVLLDGFDEVPQNQRPLVARWLNAQMRTYKRSLFIVTSRPKAYTEQDAGDRLDCHTLLWVRNFNVQQCQDFVQKWYWCQEYYHHGKNDTPAVRKVAKDAATDLLRQIEAREELTDLAKNPLLLNMIATFHRRYPGAELPKRRVELYQEMCVLQLRDRPAARRLETLLTESEPQTILQMLALEMMQRKEERVDQETLLQRLTRYLTDQEEMIAAKEFLSQVEQISELLVQREPEEFEFAHLSFQEFLAAREVVRLKQESLLYDHFGEDWWKQTILLYAAQTKKPSSLIRAALDQEAKDLAYACWQETSKRIDADLQRDLEELSTLREAAAAVQTSRYQQLEDYLKAKQWREADEETYRLMITAVGKEEGRWFTKEELLNFPCSDLKKIDRLWVHHSNGKFGFSVQKEIYKQCGAELDGEYPGDKIWNEFCDRVGWRRKGGDYVSYSDLKADPLFSLAGEFPAWVGGFGLGVGVRGLLGVLLGVSFLASRLVNCSTE